MDNQVIRLTESDLHRIVRESVNRVLRESYDIDNIGKMFIDFIEKHHGGGLLQRIIDFENGNETGIPTSPLPTIIPEFEDAVLGHKCTPEMRKAIKAAYNQWWYYAQDQLMGDSMY